MDHSPWGCKRVRHDLATKQQYGDIYIYTHTYTQIYVCVCIYIHSVCVSVYIHIYTHIHTYNGIGIYQAVLINMSNGILFSH